MSGSNFRELLNQEKEAGSTKRWKRHLVGAAITVTCFVFIARQVNFQELGNALERFYWPYLLIGLFSLSAGYSLRIVRWSVMLRAAGAQVTPINCAAPFLGSIALNNVLPLRMGDVVRALVFPSAIGIGKATATGSLVMERLVDLMTLLACLGIGLTWNPITYLPEWLSSSVLSLALISSTALIFTFFFSGRLAERLSRFAGTGTVTSEPTKREKLFIAIVELLRSFEAMSRFRVLATLFLLSMLVWVGESGLFYFLLSGFGFDVSPTLAAVVMAIATLATLVPSSPGYVGPFHLAAFAAVSMLGGSAAQAASFAVLCHMGLWLPTTLAGGAAMLLTPKLFGGLSQ